jgi:hypothetical protein
MTSFDETKHPRAAAGEFAEKTQSAPEISFDDLLASNPRIPNDEPGSTFYRDLYESTGQFVESFSMEESQEAWEAQLAVEYGVDKA